MTGRFVPWAENGGRPVIEMACGITVYPAREEGDRWRAVWYEDGQRRQCESVSEHNLAVKLEKVTERLTADAPGREHGDDCQAGWEASACAPASYAPSASSPCPRRRRRQWSTCRSCSRPDTGEAGASSTTLYGIRHSVIKKYNG
jgi:hypothetical protein